MKNGNSQKSNTTHFKCTKCGFEYLMPDWLMEEVLSEKRFVMKKVYVNACIKCDSEMLPKDFLENQK
ncbi:hypothetical protein ACWG0P_00515 [Amedibacillus sp. YH-ame6]